MEWNGIKRNGMKRNETEWKGIKQNETEGNGTKWDKTEQNGTKRNETEWKRMNWYQRGMKIKLTKHYDADSFDLDFFIFFSNASKTVKAYEISLYYTCCNLSFPSLQIHHEWNICFIHDEFMILWPIQTGVYTYFSSY